MDFNELLKVNNINIRKVSYISGLFRSPKTLLSVSEKIGEVPERIFSLLMNPIIRRGDGFVFSNVQAECRQKISKFVSKNEPIQFVFQGFPFKCHNPVETLRRTPDLGELANLQRLMDINETVKQIYPPGVTFTVLTEGSTYKNLFGASQNEIDVYQERCEYFSSLIGASGRIEFIDFLNLIGDRKKFLESCEQEENRISDKEIEQFIPVMMRSLPIISGVSFEDLLAVFGYGTNVSNLTNFEKEFGLYIKDAAKDLAIKYLAIQKAKRNFDVIGSYFPDCLYVSTTSKQDRYSFHPIHRKTRLYPHHGVPVLGSDRVDIVYLGEIVSNPEIYTAVYYDKDIENAPFYFLKGKQHIGRENGCVIN